MQRSNFLFPEGFIEPVCNFDEPAIWIKKLVIIESTEKPIRVIRKIRFKRGLNLICTEKRTSRDVHTVGHSVGKSLLVRIIRYCLGEKRYCTDTLRSAITNKLEHAYVLAQIRVDKQTWSVARPLGLESGHVCSWCIKSNRLNELLRKDSRLKYEIFLNAINKATQNCYADIGLPHADYRKACWQDLLGWLSRDQDCHFAHHADWRITDAQAGSRVLTREDAYLVMKMALGLLHPEETSQMGIHRKLLIDRDRFERDAKRYENFINETEIQLRNSIEEVKDAIHGELFGEMLKEIADEKIQSLKRLLGDPDFSKYAEICDIRKKIEDLTKENGAIEAEINDKKNSMKLKQVELEQKEKQDDDALIKDLLSARWRCLFFDKKEKAMNAGCPGKDIQNHEIVDPERKRIVREIRSELTALNIRLVWLNERQNEIKSEIGKNKHIQKDLESNLIIKRDNVNQKISLWETRSKQAKQYRAAWSQLDKYKNDHESTKKKISDSLVVQNKYRSKMNKERKRLSKYYSLVLQKIVAPDASGEIIIDGKGIRPKPSNVVSDSGTTLRTYADVLSYDLACLAASICGVGYMPRLLIHDSPRQADSEDELYYSILRFVRDIEMCHKDDNNISFQYILTTTSQPLTEINQRPFVRLRLHGRDDSGKLLKCTFGN
ncbi:MAG: hypothetical protein ACIAQZ_14800 [Sedimentisphaeraceae bacterium JB056]